MLTCCSSSNRVRRPQRALAQHRLTTHSDLGQRWPPRRTKCAATLAPGFSPPGKSCSRPARPRSRPGRGERLRLTASASSRQSLGNAPPALPALARLLLTSEPLLPGETPPTGGDPGQGCLPLTGCCGPTLSDGFFCLRFHGSEISVSVHLLNSTPGPLLGLF